MRAARLGFWSGTALVTGNMIGSGIFLLPASIATYGRYGLVGWSCAALGALLLALVFRQLGALMPHAPGGPYAYVRRTQGDLAGFVVAWGYWVSIWCTNAAIAVACVGYLGVFFPLLSSNAAVSALAGLVLIWGATGINALALPRVAAVQGFTTALKVLPLIVIMVLGLPNVDLELLRAPLAEGVSPWSAVTTATTLTLFAFLGMESAAIASHRMEDAGRTMGRASVFGTGLTIVLYIGCSVVVMGTVPPGSLAVAAAPFADSAATFLGAWGRRLVAGAAVVATLGALNGWMLIQGQFPQAVAEDGLFPGVFRRTNRQGAPIAGIALSSALASGVLLLKFSDSLVSTFTFMMTLSTLSALLPYLLSALSLWLMLPRGMSGAWHKVLAAACMAFCGWVIFGCGPEVVGYGAALLGAGLLIRLMARRRAH